MFSRANVMYNQCVAEQCLLYEATLYSSIVLQNALYFLMVIMVMSTDLILRLWSTQIVNSDAQANHLYRYTIRSETKAVCL